MGTVTAKAAKLLEVGYLDSHSSPVFVTQILSTEGVANGDCAGGVVLPGCRSLPIRNDFMVVPQTNNLIAPSGQSHLWRE
jgi:hypothetical protein